MTTTPALNDDLAQVARYNAVGYDPCMTAQHGGSWVRFSDYQALASALEAQSKEIEALRAALESIAKPAVGAGHDWSLNERAVYWRNQVALAREIARTALKGA